MTLQELPYTQRVKPEYSMAYFEKIIGWTGKFKVREESSGEYRFHGFDNGAAIRYNEGKRTIELSDKVDGVVRYAITQIIDFEKSKESVVTSEIQSEQSGSSKPETQKANSELGRLKLMGAGAA